MSRVRATRALALAFAAVLILGSACPGTEVGTPDGGCDNPCGDNCCDPGTTCNTDNNTCECTPDCGSRVCGDNGCGGSCGTCSGALGCDPQGQCTPVPDGGFHFPDTGPRPDAGPRPPDAGSKPPDAGPIPPDAGPTPDAARVGAPVPFKVMDWNVRNFFDEIDDPNTTDTVYSTTQVNNKISALAAVINAQSPDILSLQEVETKALLGRLNSSLTKSLPNYELIPSTDPRGINVAIMTRFPLLRVVSHQNDRFFTSDGRGPYFFSRDCLEAHLDIGGNRELAVLVNHQISQLEENNPNTVFKRQAQAERTRAIADAIRAATPWVAVLIDGDMNDNPGTTSMNVYLADGAYVDFWNGAVSSSVYTYKESSTVYDRFDFIMPDKVAATWKIATSLVHGTAVNSASDHSPVVVSFTFP